MTRQEHLLVKVMEECAEISHRAAKSLRFGLFQVQKAHGDRPEQNPKQLTNYERIVDEYTDLVAVMEMLTMVPSHSEIPAKKHRVETYLEFSRQHGTLREDL